MYAFKRVGGGGGGEAEYVPGVVAYFLARGESVGGESVGGAEALISQSALGEPRPTPCVPASTSALPGLFIKGLGLPIDPGA